MGELIFDASRNSFIKPGPERSQDPHQKVHARQRPWAGGRTRKLWICQSWRAKSCLHDHLDILSLCVDYKHMQFQGEDPADMATGSTGNEKRLWRICALIASCNQSLSGAHSSYVYKHLDLKEPGFRAWATLHPPCGSMRKVSLLFAHKPPYLLFKPVWRRLCANHQNKAPKSLPESALPVAHSDAASQAWLSVWR